MKTLKQKLILAFITAGLSAPAAFVAYDLTLPSEALVLSPYSDPVGLKTYCVGHLALKNEKIKDKYSEEECMALFAKDWKKHLNELDSVVKVPYASEWQRQGLNDFTFNNGITNVKSSRLIKFVNEGRHREACDELVRWVFAKGKKLKGLVTRRDKTMPYCLGELSDSKQKAYEEFIKEYDQIKKAASN